MKILRQIRQIRQTGWKYSFAIAFNRFVPQWLFRCRRFVVFQLATDDNPSPPRNTNVTVSWCELEPQIHAVEKLTYFQRSGSTGNLKACQAKIDGRLAGGFWSATQQFDEPELGIRYILAPGQAWLFAALVDKQFRRQGVYAAILKFILHELEGEGIDHPLVAVNPHNLGSYRVHRDHALRSPGTVFALRLFNVAVCFTSGEIQLSRWISLNANKNPIQIRIAAVDHP